MSASTTRTGVKYAATNLGAFAVLAVAPATAFAVDNEPTPSGSCTYTDADGYPIPIDDGQDVFVDGKIAEEGGPELADRLEAEGYDRYVNAAAEAKA